MLNEYIELLNKNKDVEATRSCANRCLNTLQVVYEREELTHNSFWKLDERYFEQGIKVLYERFCYAMAIICDRFSNEYYTKYNTREAHGKVSSFAVMLDAVTSMAFSVLIRDMGLKDGVLAYWQEDYEGDDFTGEEWEAFWQEHETIKNDIISIRESYKPNDKDDLHGFKDDDNKPHTDDANEVCNRDFLHIKRMMNLSSEIDVNKFLNDTKCDYLPFIIEEFSKLPVKDYLKKKKDRWWKKLW